MKAAGPDTLKPIIIQKSLDTDITRTSMTKNHENQHSQTLWKESLGIFLISPAKPGETDCNQPKSFRTINLSPVMLKLQENACDTVVYATWPL